MEFSEAYSSYRYTPSSYEDDDMYCTSFIRDTTAHMDIENGFANNISVKISPVAATTEANGVGDGDMEGETALALHSSSVTGAASPEEVMERIEEILLNSMDCLTKFQLPVMESKSTSSSPTPRLVSYKSL